MLRDMQLTPNEATVMVVLYVAFGLWMTLEAFGVMNLLGVSMVV